MRRGLAVHRARWCSSGQRTASRRGQLADKADKLVKRQASVALLQPVVMEGKSLESVYQFDYLGCRFTSDGDDATDMRRTCAIAWPSRVSGRVVSTTCGATTAFPGP